MSLHQRSVLFYPSYKSFLYWGRDWASIRDGYLGIPGEPGGLPQAADHLHEVVVGVGGQRISPGVKTEGGAPGYGELECDVGRRLEGENRSESEAKLGGTEG